MPFGSTSEKTKQENASLNSGPHGPWAIPPRQGQSQLISPVWGLKAPPEPPGDGDSSPVSVADSPDSDAGASDCSGRKASSVGAVLGAWNLEGGDCEEEGESASSYIGGTVDFVGF